MKAAFLAVGSELLGTDRVDTNSLRLTEVLERFGVAMERKAVIGDDETEIAGEIRRLLDKVDLVLVSGGLGPTADDVTRAAVAQALGRELVFDPEVLEDIRGKFESHGLEMPEVNRRQAEMIEGAERIPNRRGTAPGMRLDLEDGGTVFLLPGPPDELEGMIGSHLEPWLAEHTDGGRREGRTLKVACLPESTVEERIAPAYEELGRESLSILAQPGEIRLRFWAEGGEDERRQRLDAIERRLRELVGPAVFAGSEDRELEDVVGELLRDGGRTVVTAESCTGGLVAERLTRVPGSSAWFLGGAVTYTDRLKRELLGVSEEDLRESGAVSEPVARAMARGVREHLGADFGIGVTGIAGPGGGTEDKPVGTVHLAVAGPDEGRGDGDVLHRKVRFPGDRQRVRRQTGQLALELLRRRLLDESPPEDVGADQLGDVDEKGDGTGTGGGRRRRARGGNVRLFVALDLPDELARLVDRHATEARRELPRARWVRPENLHLTLAFLGEREADELSILHEHLTPAFAGVAPFEMRLHQGGTFPPRRPARVAWIGVEAPDELPRLGRRVQNALRRAVGFEPDRRGFSAHLTVARCKQPWRRREIERFQRHFRGDVGQPFEVTEGVLYQSELSPGGARYKALQRYPLGPGRMPVETQQIAG